MTVNIKNYPDIEIIESFRQDKDGSNTTYFIELRARVRKIGSDNKWYYWDYIKTMQCPIDEKDKIRQKHLEGFHIEVYLGLILTIVPCGIRSYTGELLYREDPNQESEIERLKKLIP